MGAFQFFYFSIVAGSPPLFPCCSIQNTTLRIHITFYIRNIALFARGFFHSLVLGKSLDRGKHIRLFLRITLFMSIVFVACAVLAGFDQMLPAEPSATGFSCVFHRLDLAKHDVVLFTLSVIVLCVYFGVFAFVALFTLTSFIRVFRATKSKLILVADVLNERQRKNSQRSLKTLKSLFTFCSGTFLVSHFAFFAVGVVAQIDRNDDTKR